MNNNVIIACDFDTEKELDSFLKKFKGTKPFIKIGYQLFYTIGVAGVKKYKKLGYKIFLDLKLHDIPNTVMQGVKNLAKLGVDMLTIHAAGGIEMMKAAKKYANKTKLLAVTMLTSVSEKILNKELLIKQPLKNVVLAYAKNAKKANMDGVICSVHESKCIHKNIKNFLTVTPGIRTAKDNANDQKRIATPKQARLNLSDYIVVGRSITKARNPLQVYKHILKEFNHD